MITFKLVPGRRSSAERGTIVFRPVRRVTTLLSITLYGRYVHMKRTFIGDMQRGPVGVGSAGKGNFS